MFNIDYIPSFYVYVNVFTIKMNDKVIIAIHFSFID